MLPGAKKDDQNIKSDWTKLHRLIEGVVIQEVRHVPGDNGVLTEVFRADWGITVEPVVHVFQIRLYPGAINAWHCHANGADRLFANHGHLKFVLFDARPDSGTFGHINEFHVGDSRPTLIVVPAQIWHGVQNLSQSDGLFLNLPTIAYRYEDPDHWRLPQDSPEIPYTWVRP